MSIVPVLRQREPFKHVSPDYSYSGEGLYIRDGDDEGSGKVENAP
jgi:hypothetical protein